MRYDEEHLRHADELELQGFDPYSRDDSVLGAQFVYCGSHLRAHSSGWCTVPLVDKYPLAATTDTAANDEARANGWRIYGDPS